MNVENMIYIKDEHIIFVPDKKEYDITDYVSELVEELGKLKAR